ncbi:MAG: ATP-dependent helicase [Candidatus Marinimicrobia bacterium]|jgi:DNA helicase-2/ATP-dependent DNA helicase PcrA|nr:ATP-dependent helicase [Candidatus Neomarinimicrobiota bacterium]MBT3495936.1 ATP-dependent helicase [Candidatus Neomarinimicrobiota bacterium]MBT3692275.1 ATP-dependent helicase [Candidatus Neomarinimicrobiota bacterium]MBT3731809.1 ATP-dependent helicase [Candidatus Neomarinimicrobiota bacterium]MBT4143828.1 ATP-dependent helicase [Candidatus Neomarinimicrobiota bacterium]
MAYQLGNFKAHPLQEKAIRHPASPLMILAGAGTGKTSTLIHRIHYQVSQGFMKPEHIVILTFTEKATNELKIKLSKMDDIDSKKMRISTFHAFCNNMVRDFSDSPDADKLLIQENDTAFLILQHYDKLTFLKSSYFRSNPIESIKNAFIPFFGRIRDELLSPADLDEKMDELTLSSDKMHALFPGLSDRVPEEEYLFQFQDLIQVYKRYQAWKNEKGFVDYGDMILDCYEMLRSSPKILNTVRDKMQHIIIDEYQDNNYALNKIVNLIVEKNPSITVVGDEDQCIYSFRGANYFNITDFRSRYQHTDNYGEVELEINYRSSQPILDLANYSIANDSNRTEKILEAFNNQKGPVPIWHVGNKSESMEEIVRQIQDYVFKKAFAFGDIAVICRSVANIRLVAKTLQHASIPTDVFVERFFSIPEIKDVMAWGLLTFDNPRNGTAFTRLVKRNHSRELARKCAQHLPLKNFDQILPKISELVNIDLYTKDEIQVIEKICNNIQAFRKRLKQKIRPVELIWGILYKTQIMKNTRKSYRYRERLILANMGHFMSLADQFSQQDKHYSVQDFMQYMEILSSDGKYPAIQPSMQKHSGAIKVMTIHKSKGLEFPIVFVPFLRSGSFPSTFKKASQITTLPEPWYQWEKPKGFTPKIEHFNEERRIFYVALTRAQTHLHLFGPSSYRSQLLKEIDEKLDSLTRRQDMPDAQDASNQSTSLPEKLLVELNRELAAGQWDLAREIVDGLQSIAKTGSLPKSHVFASLNDADSDTELPATSGLLNLSASAIEEYAKCSYKYRLGKLDGFPEKKSSAQMEFGNIIHKTLQSFHEIDDIRLEKLLELFEQNWRSDAFEYLIREEEFKIQGHNMMKDYFNFVQSNPPNVVKCEASFEFIMEDINVRLKGKIDRIDKVDNKLFVLDYKTGKLSSNEKSKKSLQLALYIEALNRGAVKDVKGETGAAQLLYLKDLDTPLDPHEFNEKELEKHLEKVRKAADGIRNGIFEPKPGPFVCKYCDYQDFLCPAWEE